MALAADLLGDRWTLLILREAFYGVGRYDDMRQDLNAPRATLTDRLSKLVKLGILAREPYQESGDRLRHGYKLTRAGRALAHVLIAMTEWGEEFVLKARAPVEIVEAASGKPLRLSLVDDAGHLVPTAKSVLVRRGKR